MTTILPVSFTPDFDDFKSQLGGISVSQISGAHGRQWQVIAPNFTLNYYPDSKRKTLCIDKRDGKAPETIIGYTPSKVLEYAGTLTALKPVRTLGYSVHAKATASPIPASLDLFDEMDTVDLVDALGGVASNIGGENQITIKQPTGDVLIITATEITMKNSRGDVLDRIHYSRGKRA